MNMRALERMSRPTHPYPVVKLCASNFDGLEQRWDWNTIWLWVDCDPGRRDLRRSEVGDF